jgi:hypothetical protein
MVQKLLATNKKITNGVYSILKIKKTIMSKIIIY